MALDEVLRALTGAASRSFAVIGAVARNAWAPPRATSDLDLAVIADADAEALPGSQSSTKWCACSGQLHQNTKREVPRGGAAWGFHLLLREMRGDTRIKSVHCRIQCAYV